MGRWEDAHWESGVDSGLPRSARRSGTYRRYVPDLLDGAPLAIQGALSRSVAEAERQIRDLNGDGAEGLAGNARFLLRSEAIASSRIEGIAPSAQQVALAELGQTENVRGVSAQARLVANNMTVVRRATTELVEAGAVTTDAIVELHRSLLPDEPRHHGLRKVQNWIGGSDWTPIEADFVPPAPERVSMLMSDLVEYMNGAAHSPLIQAALVHAQFETIHPFTDGNGRVGRALIHAVLARRGLTEQAVLPVSLVLATLRDRYVGGLTAYRHDSATAGREGTAAITTWMQGFVEAAAIAAEQSRLLVEQVGELQDEWRARVAVMRGREGLRPSPRADSATSRLLELLPEAPVVTATTLKHILDVSYPAASAAVEELRRAGVVATKTVERGATAYIARDVLDLISVRERALASTRFDTRVSEPIRPVPTPPRQESV